MKSEPVLITMAVVALRSLFNIVLTPEDAENLQLVVEGIILLVGGIVARSQVTPVRKKKRTHSRI
jgi:hypothetical protein